MDAQKQRGRAASGRGTCGVGEQQGRVASGSNRHGPLLFVLAADLLQTILNKAMQMQIINSPLEMEVCR